MIDKRDNFNEKDLNIMKYLIETTNSQIELSQTNEMIIKGPPKKENIEKNIIS